MIQDYLSMVYKMIKYKQIEAPIDPSLEKKTDKGDGFSSAEALFAGKRPGNVPTLQELQAKDDHDGEQGEEREPFRRPEQAVGPRRQPRSGLRLGVERPPDDSGHHQVAHPLRRPKRAAGSRRKPAPRRLKRVEGNSNHRAGKKAPDPRRDLDALAAAAAAVGVLGLADDGPPEGRSQVTRQGGESEREKQPCSRHGDRIRKAAAVEAGQQYPPFAVRLISSCAWKPFVGWLVGFVGRALIFFRVWSKRDAGFAQRPPESHVDCPALQREDLYD